jgi:putative nucleotidyltransferase with HDIG domain
MLASLQQAINNTPLLSTGALQILQRNADPDCELADIVEIVRCDAALTAKVLRTVNSAAFGLVVPVESVERAVTYLGSWMIASIAIADSAARLLQQPMTGYEGERGELWRHDLFTAFAAREVSRFGRIDIAAQTAFTAGLLHDIGKAVVSEFLAGTANQVVADIEAGRTDDYPTAERALLGVDHAEVGYQLSLAWGLPPLLQETIRFHHRPDAASAAFQPVVYAVHLGDLLAMMAGYGTGSDCLQHRLLSQYADFLQLDAKALEQALLAAQQEFLRAEASITQAQE